MRIVFAILLAAVPLLAADTWYIRTDGGTSAQCTGKVDAAYPGKGEAQPCAFSNPFWLWTNDPASNKAAETPKWKIAGGDTVLIKAGTYGMGWKSPAFDVSSWWNYTGCRGNNHGCYNPPIPSGSPGAPTRIVGEGWDKGCPAPVAVLSGRGATNTPLSVMDAAHVEVGCLEITDASQCRLATLTGEPYGCRNYTDDYGYFGLMTNLGTRDVSLHDLNIHGMGAVGISGAVGPGVVATRVRLSGNGNIGWNFDPGGQVASNGPFKASYITAEYSGCVERFPLAEPRILGCYDQAGANANGDGIGFVDFTGSVALDHLTVRRNLQDGVDALYVKSADRFELTDSTITDNEGQALKTGGATNTFVRNNYLQANCDRLLDPISDGTPDYNKLVKGTCRGNDAIAMMFRDKTQVHFEHNTVVASGPNLLNIQCRAVVDTFSGDGKTREWDLKYPASLFYATGGVYIYEADGKTRTPLRAGLVGSTDCAGYPCQVFYTAGSPRFLLADSVAAPAAGQTVRVEYFAPSACATGSLSVQNNIFRGYKRPMTGYYPGYLWMNTWPSGVIAETWKGNLACQFRNPVTHPGEVYAATCPGDWLTMEPDAKTPADLDALDMHLAPTSPAKGAAVTLADWPEAGPDIGVSYAAAPPPVITPEPTATGVRFYLDQDAAGAWRVRNEGDPLPAGSMQKYVITIGRP